MSYDCCWVARPELPERPAVTTYEDQLVRDVQYGDFHVSNRTWRFLLEEMYQHDMLAGGEPPQFPKAADFGLVTPIHDPEDDPTTRPFWDAHAAALATPPDGPGIAIWKLTSNDGWFVSEAEVQSALATIDEPITTVDPESDFGGFVWQLWLQFLRGAACHGGFLVY